MRGKTGLSASFKSDIMGIFMYKNAQPLELKNGNEHHYFNLWYSKMLSVIYTFNALLFTFVVFTVE